MWQFHGKVYDSIPNPKLYKHTFKMISDLMPIIKVYYSVVLLVLYTKISCQNSQSMLKHHVSLKCKFLQIVYKAIYEYVSCVIRKRQEWIYMIKYWSLLHMRTKMVTLLEKYMSYDVTNMKNSKTNRIFLIEGRADSPT